MLTDSSGLPGTLGGQPSPCLALLLVGFTDPPRSPGALVVSYTTVSPLPVGSEGAPSAVCSLLYFPSGCPVWELPSTVPSGVRTFLDRSMATATVSQARNMNASDMTLCSRKRLRSVIGTSRGDWGRVATVHRRTSYCRGRTKERCQESAAGPWSLLGGSPPVDVVGIGLVEGMPVQFMSIEYRRFSRRPSWDAQRSG